MNHLCDAVLEAAINLAPDLVDEADHRERQFLGTSVSREVQSDSGVVSALLSIREKFLSQSDSDLTKAVDRVCSARRTKAFKLVMLLLNLPLKAISFGYLGWSRMTEPVIDEAKLATSNREWLRVCESLMPGTAVLFFASERTQRKLPLPVWKRQLPEPAAAEVSEEAPAEVAEDEPAEGVGGEGENEANAHVLADVRKAVVLDSEEWEEPLALLDKLEGLATEFQSTESKDAEALIADVATWRGRLSVFPLDRFDALASGTVNPNGWPAWFSRAVAASTAVHGVRDTAPILRNGIREFVLCDDPQAVPSAAHEAADSTPEEESHESKNTHPADEDDHPRDEDISEATTVLEKPLVEEIN